MKLEGIHLLRSYCEQYLEDDLRQKVSVHNHKKIQKVFSGTERNKNLFEKNLNNHSKVLYHRL